MQYNKGWCYIWNRTLWIQLCWEMTFKPVLLLQEVHLQRSMATSGWWRVGLQRDSDVLMCIHLFPHWLAEFLCSWIGLQSHTWMNAGEWPSPAESICGQYRMWWARISVFKFVVHLRDYMLLPLCLHRVEVDGRWIYPCVDSYVRPYPLVLRLQVSLMATGFWIRWPKTRKSHDTCISSVHLSVSMNLCK